MNIRNLSTNSPSYSLKEKEFDNALLVFGSLLSILKNKKINTIIILTSILNDKYTQECFKQISGIDNIQTIAYNIIVRNPILCKSKIIKRYLRKQKK